MDRSAAYTYLTRQFKTLFSDAGIDYNDPQALDQLVDDALLMTGVPAGDLATAIVPDADVLGFRDVLRYTALRSAYDAVVNRVDVQMSDPNVTKNRSQFVKQLEEAVKRALAAATPYMVEATPGFTTGAIVFGDDLIGSTAREWA